MRNTLVRRYLESLSLDPSNVCFVGKWFGACNQLKSDLDECFFLEKEMKRSNNLQKARDFDAKFEEYERVKEERKQAAQTASKKSSS